MQLKSSIDIFKDSFPDAKELTDNQIVELLKMLGDALVEIRNLSFMGHSTQSHHLADAFHNLPFWLTSEVFSFQHFRNDFLKSYCEKYQNNLLFDYLKMLDEIENKSNLITFEEYFENLKENDLIEWVDGKIVPHNFSRSLKHQDLLNFLLCLLGVYVHDKKLGILHKLPFLLKLNKTNSVRQPDLMFIKNENKDKIRNYWVEDKAELIIEIVSRESAKRDLKDKFEEYEKAGVKEYWIIDPKRRTANFYGFNKNKKYEQLLLNSDKVFESRIIEGLWIKTDWLWQEELPNLMDILKEWELV